MPENNPIEAALQAKTSGIQRGAKTSIIVNLTISLVQLLVGLFANSQALVADSIHTLSDLISDFFVLLAGRYGGKAPDSVHHYGHLRFETAASLALGVLLLIVGIGMFWSAIEKLANPDLVTPVGLAALWVAMGALATKELLYRYLLSIAKQTASSMLVASALHARSDAASSLVVSLGVLGSLLGVHILDPLAALFVGLLISKMGGQTAWQALHDLVDRSADNETVTAIRVSLLDTPGVLGVHDLRTRKMSDMILVDAHLEILGSLSIHAGHNIALEARRRLMARGDILNLMTHVDPV
ncbi:cation diffusion facilitator family transporter [Cupriavidus metallidurans]|uniref:Cation transporter n=1 Tax=Cupriavidus metallidurans TaxID=119219 RepID=A0A482IXA0_9BURK|nr:cation diffusion facilitator family transporter [Cupriavidus metallidurans]QBP12552.1 cation transporter [Cupriavidus metallidurans]